jgi:chromosome segregation ATPase
VPEAAFRLELADGSLLELPAPAPGAARPPAGTADQRVRDLAAENERLSSTLAELEVWRGELERRLTETTDQLADARARLTAAELEALSLRAEAEATRQAARELEEATGAGSPSV